MMNVFYHDRITMGLATIEEATSKLNYADAKNAMNALTEVRRYVDTIYELSKAMSHIWNENSYVLGPNWEEQQAGRDPITGEQYTYVDQWEARYELIRREIVRKLQEGYSIEMLPPLVDSE